MSASKQYLIASDWDFFVREEALVPRFYMVDLGLRPYAPLTSHENLLIVHIPLRDPDPNGLTRSQEAEVLFVLEDVLSRRLTETLGAIYAGRITGKGKRSFYFYCASATGLPFLLAEILDDFDQYQPEHTLVSDPHWRHYLDHLYPLPSEQLSIQHRRNREAG